MLADIAPLVERLQRSEKGRQVLPDGFAELWDLVWAARSSADRADIVSRFDAEPILAPLKDFQRATVEHVTDRLYRNAQPSRRFLVADETGLGKSLVARGVIARAIEQLQDDDSVDRIDVVYVCSNSDIADQNLKRLNVTGQDHLPFASRLTLLAKHSRRLAAQPEPRRTARRSTWCPSPRGPPSRWAGGRARPRSGRCCTSSS